jgi:D-sedoheptulose 7-phosphate isomerase
MWDNIVEEALRGGIRLREEALKFQIPFLLEVAEKLAGCLAAGGKILLFGNGGSAADAQHIAGELVNRFLWDRPPLAALALTTDTSVLTSIANDFGFNEVFAKQIRALGQAGDFAWGFTTSGNSPNVVRGLQAARELNLNALVFTGEGGEVAGLADYVLKIPSRETPRIQEMHITCGHILCHLIDQRLYPPPSR